jgi:hypothetical protein
VTDARQSEKDVTTLSNERATNRRSFIKGAGIGALGAVTLASAPEAFGKGTLTRGDAAILRFLAAAEILETDLWQQYNELCGMQDSEVSGGTGNKQFTRAVEQLDSDMSQYVHDNTEDEHSHFTFINAYLMSHGAEPVNLDQFRTLPGSTATGSANTKRITNGRARGGAAWTRPWPSGSVTRRYCGSC